ATRKREDRMAVGIIMEFDGFSPDTYEAVREKIDWPAKMPEGISFHVAGPTGDGMRLVEIWSTREQYDRWMEETIQPALEEVVGGRPSRTPCARLRASASRICCESSRRSKGAKLASRLATGSPAGLLVSRL